MHSKPAIKKALLALARARPDILAQLPFDKVAAVVAAGLPGLEDGRVGDRKVVAASARLGSSVGNGDLQAGPASLQARCGRRGGARAVCFPAARPRWCAHDGRVPA